MNQALQGNLWGKMNPETLVKKEWHDVANSVSYPYRIIEPFYRWICYGHDGLVYVVVPEEIKAKVRTSIDSPVSVSLLLSVLH
uniref:Uncharacterized protein n=1 Tax=mine drainage metagenome TaxID=410659 RepID=E6QTE8_9ZZZZ